MARRQDEDTCASGTVRVGSAGSAQCGLCARGAQGTSRRCDAHKEPLPSTRTPLPHSDPRTQIREHTCLLVLSSSLVAICDAPPAKKEATLRCARSCARNRSLRASGARVGAACRPGRPAPVPGAVGRRERLGWQKCGKPGGLIEVPRVSSRVSCDSQDLNGLPSGRESRGRRCR